MNRHAYDIIVVGGGPAGMFSAGHAAAAGARVLLLERTGQLGKKLLITGKGRCNLTNARDRNEFIRSYGANGPFLYRAFREYFNEDLMGFFRGRGVPVKVERGGRVFPESDESDSIVTALHRFLEEHRVTVRFAARVIHVLVTPNGRVCGVRFEGGKDASAPCVILATGGLSYPGTGSTGDGYRIAGERGHTIVAPRPGLVPLETADTFVVDLDGLTLKNVAVTAIAGGKKIADDFGEMQFTRFGVAGPVILTLSGMIDDRLRAGERVEISINLKPALDHETLKRRLLRELESGGHERLTHIMKTLLPMRLVPVFIRLSGIAPDKKASQITRTEREHIQALLSDFRLKITRARPVEEAIVTRGGVALAEIDPHTMESRKVPGLYFCGELIDIDATTGGYNLQAAFSTGFLAGKSAGEKYRG
jgi:predicted Rossmann fold flavoprotein